jgi:hypothetical protein
VDGGVVDIAMVGLEPGEKGGEGHGVRRGRVPHFLKGRYGRGKMR